MSVQLVDAAPHADISVSHSVPKPNTKHYWCGTHQLATSRSRRYTCRTPGGTNMHRQHPRAGHQIETCTGVMAPGKRKGDYDKNATSLRWGVEADPPYVSVARMSVKP